MSNEEFNRSTLKGALRALLFLLVIVFAGMFMASWLGVFTKVATAPARVINRTLDTNEIIAGYEWFYDASAAYDARIAQIKAHSALAKGELDRPELHRLNIELMGMRQVCRDLATKYNANSEKMNKAIFKSNNLPERLSLVACDA